MPGITLLQLQGTTTIKLFITSDFNRLSC